MTTTDRAPRRRHAAGASRILVGGLSVATTLGLTAHWGAAAERVELTDVTTAAPVPVAPAQRVVIVRRIIREVRATAEPSATSAATSPSPAPTPAAPAAAPAAPAPAVPAAVPALPSAALAPPPVVSAPAPAASSGGS